MFGLSVLRYVPLISIALVSLGFGVYFFEEYSDSYSTLYEFAVYVNDITVTYGQKIEVNTSLVFYNPSESELKLTYFEAERVFLNNTRIVFENPFVSKHQFQRDYVIKLPARSNSSYDFLGYVEAENFSDNYDSLATNEWNFRMIITLDNVPLLKIASLSRFAFFRTGSLYN